MSLRQHEAVVIRVAEGCARRSAFPRRTAPRRSRRRTRRRSGGRFLLRWSRGQSRCAAAWRRSSARQRVMRFGRARRTSEKAHYNHRMLALRYVYVLALVVWLGGMVMLGAVVAPTTFEVLQASADRQPAASWPARVFGAMLTRFHYVAYGAGALLLLTLGAMRVLGPRPAHVGVRAHHRRRHARRRALFRACRAAADRRGAGRGGRTARRGCPPATRGASASTRSTCCRPA